MEKGLDFFEDLEEMEPRTVPPTGGTGAGVKDHSLAKDKPAEKTDKSATTAPKTDNQLEAAVNLMKAINIYEREKS